MPSFTYRCRDCNAMFREMSTIKHRNATICKCGGKAKRDMEAELASVGRRSKWVTEKERWSTSMGVPAGQVEEFRKRFPDSTYHDDGRLLIKGRSDKLRQAKERNFNELNDNTSKAWFR